MGAATEPRSHGAKEFRWSRFIIVGFSVPILLIVVLVWIVISTTSASVMPWATLVNTTDREIVLQFIHAGSDRRSLHHVEAESEVVVYPLDITESARLFRDGVLIVVGDAGGGNIRTIPAGALLEEGLVRVIVGENEIAIEHQAFRGSVEHHNGVGVQP